MQHQRGHVILGLSLGSAAPWSDSSHLPPPPFFLLSSSLVSPWYTQPSSNFRIPLPRLTSSRNLRLRVSEFPDQMSASSSGQLEGIAPATPTHSGQGDGIVISHVEESRKTTFTSRKGFLNSVSILFIAVPSSYAACGRCSCASKERERFGRWWWWWWWWWWCTPCEITFFNMHLCWGQRMALQLHLVVVSVCVHLFDAHDVSLLLPSFLLVDHQPCCSAAAVECPSQAKSPEVFESKLKTLIIFEYLTLSPEKRILLGCTLARQGFVGILLASCEPTS